MTAKKHRTPIKKSEMNPSPLPLSLPLPASTTEQEDIVTAGQRRINLIWEYTQAFIAVTVILANMGAGLVYAWRGEEGNIPAILSSSLFLVIGFYFSRTNHEKIGGVGIKKGTR